MVLLLWGALACLAVAYGANVRRAAQQAEQARQAAAAQLANAQRLHSRAFVLSYRAEQLLQAVEARMR